MPDIVFYEETPISKVWIGTICLKFNGDIRDFREHFPYITIMETEGAGIWHIKIQDND